MATALTNGTVGILVSCSTPARPLPFTEGAVAERKGMSKGDDEMEPIERFEDQLTRLIDEAYKQGCSVDGVGNVMFRIVETMAFAEDDDDQR